MTGFSGRTVADHPDHLPLWHKSFNFKRLSDHIRQALTMPASRRSPMAV